MKHGMLGLPCWLVSCSVQDSCVRSLAALGDGMGDEYLPLTVGHEIQIGA